MYPFWIESQIASLADLLMLLGGSMVVLVHYVTGHQ